MTTTNHTSKYLFRMFAGVVVIISATTSFMFFADFLPSLIEEVLPYEDGGWIVSGLMGVMLLDVACLVWLKVGSDAETTQQRDISAIGACFAFGGSALASVAHLALNASSVVLPEETVYTISMIALVGVIAAVVVNFGLAIMFGRHSRQAQQHRREIERALSVTSTEDNHASQFDRLVAELAKQQLEKQAPKVAAEKAEQLAHSFFERERDLLGKARQNGK